MRPTRSNTANMRNQSSATVRQSTESNTSVRSDPGPTRPNQRSTNGRTSPIASTSSRGNTARSTQTAQCKPGHYPISGLERQGPVYDEDGTLWAERGVLVEHEMMVYRLEDVDAPDLEPKAYGPINKPGSGEKYMYAYSAAEILAKEKADRLAARRAHRGAHPEAKCRFCGREFSRRGGRDEHERDRCRFPRAPHHECDDLCRAKEEECPGAKPYNKAPDRRFR